MTMADVFDELQRLHQLITKVGNSSNEEHVIDLAVDQLNSVGTISNLLMRYMKKRIKANVICAPVQRTVSTSERSPVIQRYTDNPAADAQILVDQHPGSTSIVAKPHLTPKKAAAGSIIQRRNTTPSTSCGRKRHETSPDVDPMDQIVIRPKMRRSNSTKEQSSIRKVSLPMLPGEGTPSKSDLTDAACAVCGKTEINNETGEIVFCDGNAMKCNLAVHQTCYGIRVLPPNDEKWLCSLCQAAVSDETVNCELCPKKRGAFKCIKETSTLKTTGWAHVVCVLFIGKTVKFNDTVDREFVTIKMDEDLKMRFSALCAICKERKDNNASMKGAVLFCQYKGCRDTFHVTCGQEKGLLVSQRVPGEHWPRYLSFCEKHIGFVTSKGKDIERWPKLSFKNKNKKRKSQT